MEEILGDSVSVGWRNWRTSSSSSDITHRWRTHVSIVQSNECPTLRFCSVKIQKTCTQFVSKLARNNVFKDEFFWLRCEKTRSRSSFWTYKIVGRFSRFPTNIWRRSFSWDAAVWKEGSKSFVWGMASLLDKWRMCAAATKLLCARRETPKTTKAVRAILP